MSTRRTLTVTASALLAVGLSAAPAMADSAEPNPATTVTVDGNQVTITTDLATVQNLCDRADRAMTRLDLATTRLTADATTQGSLAWVRVQRDQARAAGRPAAADRWQLALDRRERRLPRLQEAAENLGTAYESVCTALPTPGQS
jgi:hypothetical protein